MKSVSPPLFSAPREQARLIWTHALVDNREIYAARNRLPVLVGERVGHDEREDVTTGVNFGEDELADFHDLTGRAAFRFDGLILFLEQNLVALTDDHARAELRLVIGKLRVVDDGGITQVLFAREDARGGQRVVSRKQDLRYA